MDEPTPSRKLTAILAADVANYSRMMRADQSGTVTRLAACRSIFDEAVALHQGRIANTAGDSVLAEFSSVVDALHSAIEIQAALTRENEALPPKIAHVVKIVTERGSSMCAATAFPDRLEATKVTVP